MLSLAEEIVLLALLEKKEAVRVASSLSLPFGLAGAALLELGLSGQARVVDGRLALAEKAGLSEDIVPSGRTVSPGNASAAAENTPSGNARPVEDTILAEDEMLKEVIEKIRRAERPRRLDHWVGVLGMRGNRRVKGTVASLLQKGILVEGSNGLRWGNPGCAEPQGSFSAKYQLKRRLRDAVFCDDKVDRHTTALLGLMEACGMLDHIFTRDELIMARKQLKLLRKDERLGEPFLSLLGQALSAIEYAVAASVSV